MDVSLDPTLGCGQAHRWRKDGEIWRGVLGRKIVSLRQTEEGFECSGGISRSAIEDYFRSDDDLSAIYREISDKDAHMARLAESCPGMRILRQDRWECLATYVLATNANVKRIAMMVGAVCDAFGDDIGGMRSFPSPEQILNRPDLVPGCRLGFRAGRFLELAERTENGEIDLDRISELGRKECIEELMEINGVGPKVSDCVALFAFGHLDSFPVDARISKFVEKHYGISGNYRRVSEYGMEKFGRYAGYAQELLYHSDYITF